MPENIVLLSPILDAGYADDAADRAGNIEEKQVTLVNAATWLFVRDVF